MEQSIHIQLAGAYKEPTQEAKQLREALARRGVTAYLELNDGFKHIDVAIPGARLNVEVDGVRHLTDPKQIVADLGRGFYSHKNGYDTMHIPNEMIHTRLDEIADALAEASRIRAAKLHVVMK